MSFFIAMIDIFRLRLVSFALTRNLVALLIFQGTDKSK